MILPLLGVGLVWAFIAHAKAAEKVTAAAPKQVPAVKMAQVANLMKHEFHPAKLKRAAAGFGAEGLGVLAKQLHDKAQQIEAQAKAIPDVVERARAGDQNAMALIAEVRDQAQKGVSRAGVSCELIRQYCQRNPVQPSPEDNFAVGCAS